MEISFTFQIEPRKVDDTFFKIEWIKAMHKDLNILSVTICMIDLMWSISQSHFHVSCLILFIWNAIYLLSFLCDICNEVHKHM